MPITQRNTLAPNNLVYTTGNYINPLWILSLAPAKVGSGIPQWNASQLQGRYVSPNYPLIGDVLQWNGSSWFPTGVAGGGTYTSTGVMSFNSRTGVVVLTSGDVTGALTYTPYNNTNPSGYITSSNVIFSTGSYSNPSWLTSINSNIISGAITVPSGSAQWNASQLKGYAVSGNVPATGQVLTWDGNSWYAADITAGGDHIIGDIYASPSGKIFTGNVLLNGAISGVLSNTTITPIDSTPYASGDCIKYIIKAKYGSAVQATEVLVVSNGTDSYMTEYGVLYSSGKLLNVSADLNSSNIRLLGQATYSNTSIHMMKVLIA